MEERITDLEHRMEIVETALDALADYLNVNIVTETRVEAKGSMGFGDKEDK